MKLKKTKYELYSFHLLLLAIALIVLVSCTKQSSGIYEERNCDLYELRIDYYTLDTIPLVMSVGDAAGKTSFTWYKDTLCDTRVKGRGVDTTYHLGIKEVMDNISEVWYRMCAVPGQNFQWLEHWYYLKNGKRVLPTTEFPKQ